MRVGSIVFATWQGLGILGKSFYDNGVITDVLIQKHRNRPEQRDWYPGASYYQHDYAYKFCQSMDVMLFLETPFDWNLMPYCREHGVKTVVMPMYECMPREIPHRPDLWLCPSLLDQQYFPGANHGERGKHEECDSVFLPVPVSV